MKNTFRILFLCAFGLMSIQTFAQVNNATMTEEGVVVLSPDHALVDTYSMNIAGMEFSSDASARTFFSEPVPHVVIRVLPGHATANLHLQLNEVPTWTVTDWNTHLENHGFTPANAIQTKN